MGADVQWGIIGWEETCMRLQIGESKVRMRVHKCVFVSVCLTMLDV